MMLEAKIGGEVESEEKKDGSMWAFLFKGKGGKEGRRETAEREVNQSLDEVE